MRIQFSVIGEPRGKQRPRYTKTGRVYTPSETVAYEKRIRSSFLWHIPDEAHTPVMSGPVRISIMASYQIPKSASVKQKQALESMPATKKPDVDNIAKIVMDGLNKVAYEDDKQVVAVDVSKKWSICPGLLITVEDYEETEQ